MPTTNASVMDKSSGKRLHSTPGYAPGHAGDPQYAVPIAYRVIFPEDFYAIQLLDGRDVVDDSFPEIKNIKEIFDFMDEDGIDDKDSKEFLSKFVFPTIKLSDVSNKVPAGGDPNIELALVDKEGKPLIRRKVSEFLSDPDLTAWVKASVAEHFKKYINDESNWKIRDHEENLPDPDYRSAASLKTASEVVPTLEALMEKLEKLGMEKQASTIKGVIAMFPQIDLRERRMHSQGRKAPGETYSFDPSKPMLQEGDQYTEINPQTGGEFEKRYKMDKPLGVHQLEPYFSKGMFEVDWLKGEVGKEKDPAKKAVLNRLLDKAVAQESAMRGKQASQKASGDHWLSKPIELHIPPRKDPTEIFLMEALKTAPEVEKGLIANLLDKYRESRAPARSMVYKCASTLRSKGYDALAERLELKVATGIWKIGDPVVIRSMAEHMADLKVESVDKNVSLYDAMFDLYIRTLEEAAAVVKTAKVDAHKLKDIEEALKVVVKADQLMMQKLMQIANKGV
jgi:hypothetical protein